MSDMRMSLFLFAFAALCGIACAGTANAGGSRPFVDPGHPGTPDWTRRGRDVGSEAFPAPATAYDRSRLVPERLGRGVVAWRDSTNTVCVGWRYLSCDPVRQSFDVYCDGVKVNDRPVSTVTQLRLPYCGRATYSVKALMPTSRPVRGGDRWTVPAAAPVGYIRIPLSAPPGGETHGEKYRMMPNDCSMGDLDGDGVMDLVVKWSPTNARDNAHAGHTGPTWLEGVKVATGRSLWRINLGPNCRSGEHYNPFLVYDFDGDGRAELIVRTSDGTVDGTGLYSTGMGHGDAINLLQTTPYDRGLQVWTCQENRRDGAVLRDARTGKTIKQIKSRKDVPRAVAGDVDGCTPGTEMWSASGIGMYDGEQNFIGWPKAGLAFWAYFAGDMTVACVSDRGMFAMCTKTHAQWPLARFEGVHLINGTKSVPCLQGDMFGDWREEVVLPSRDDAELRLYLSPCDPPYRFWTLLEDPPYRESVAAQNVGYNQPPQPGFYFGPDMLGHGIWFRGTYLPKWNGE